MSRRTLGGKAHGVLVPSVLAPPNSRASIHDQFAQLRAAAGPKAGDSFLMPELPPGMVRHFLTPHADERWRDLVRRTRDLPIVVGTTFAHRELDDGRFEGFGTVVSAPDLTHNPDVMLLTDAERQLIHGPLRRRVVAALRSGGLAVEALVGVQPQAEATPALPDALESVVSQSALPYDMSSALKDLSLRFEAEIVDVAPTEPPMAMSRAASDDEDGVPPPFDSLWRAGTFGLYDRGLLTQDELFAYLIFALNETTHEGIRSTLAARNMTAAFMPHLAHAANGKAFVGGPGEIHWPTGEAVTVARRWRDEQAVLDRENAQGPHAAFHGEWNARRVPTGEPETPALDTSVDLAQLKGHAEALAREVEVLQERLEERDLKITALRKTMSFRRRRAEETEERLTREADLASKAKEALEIEVAALTTANAELQTLVGRNSRQLARALTHEETVLLEVLDELIPRFEADPDTVARLHAEYFKVLVAIAQINAETILAVLASREQARLEGTR